MRDDGRRRPVVTVNRHRDDVVRGAPFVGHKSSGNGQPEGEKYVYSGLTDLQASHGL